MSSVTSVSVEAAADDAVRIRGDGWDGELIRTSRRALVNAKTSYRRHHPAVYILYDNRFEASPRHLYVGHTGDVDTRFGQHHAKKEFWTAALIFRSASDAMNIAHTQTIEHRFIESVRTASRYFVTNGTEGAAAHLGATDAAFVEDYTRGARDVLTLLGIDVFTPNDDAVFTFTDKSGGRKLKSRLRLMGIDPPTVQFLSGSIVHVFDKEAGQVDAKAVLPGDAISHDSSEGTYTFTADAAVRMSGSLSGYMWSVFGVGAARWENDQAQTLADILKFRRKGLTV